MSGTWAEAEAKVIELSAEVERLRAEANVLEAHLAAANAEGDRLRADLESRAVVSQERLQLEGLSLAGVMEIKAERDGLRAVLAETPENVAAVIASIEHPEARDVVWDGRRILAALRARAGMEPTPAGHEGPIRCGRCRENVCLCGGAP